MSLPVIKASDKKRLLVRRSCSVMSGAPPVVSSRLDQFDCWPSNANRQRISSATGGPLLLSALPSATAESALRPALVDKMEQRIAAGISAVRFHFTDMQWEPAAPPTLPAGVPPTWWLQDEVVYHPGVPQRSPAAENEALSSRDSLFALARLNVFRDTAKEFCCQFRHFQDILCTIFAEYDHYIRFLVRYMKQERQELAATKDHLEERVAELEAELEACQRRNAQQELEVQRMGQQILEHNEKLREATSAGEELRTKAGLFDSTVLSAEMEKGVLARQIMSLESEVKGLLKRLELPEKRIAVLEQQLSAKEDFLVYTNRQLEKAQLEAQTHKRIGKGRAPPSQLSDKTQTERELGAALERESRLMHLLATETKLAASFRNASLENECPLPAILKQYEGLEGSQTMRMIGELVGHLEIRASAERRRADDIMRLRDGYQLSDRYSPSDFYPEKSGACRWFLAHGMEESVPYYMRAEGRIRNCKFSLKALKMSIHTFMANESSPTSVQTDFPTRFHNWMAQTHGEEVLPMTYSFMHTLKLFPYDVDVFLFSQLLEGKSTELVWMQPYYMGDLMKAEMEKMSVVEGHGGMRLPQGDAVYIVCKSLSTWETGHVQHLVSLIPNQGPLEFRQLFSNKKHVECDFLQALRSLWLIERLRFLDDLQQCILEDVNITFHKVTPSMFVSALAIVDPKRQEEMVLDALQKVFGPDLVAEIPKLNPEMPIATRFDRSEVAMLPEEFFKKLSMFPWVRSSHRQQLPF
jgi:hypothetical protein